MCVAAPEAVATQIVCDNTKKLVSSLKEEYNEQPIVIGRASDEAASIMTLWYNPATKSWTILATKDDTSCIIGIGTGLEVISRKPYQMI
jgi:hypothetical protein